MKLALLAFALLSAPAIAAEQFDLNCTLNNLKPQHFRIDLAAGEWCRDECKATHKLAGVTSTRITFFDEKTDRSSTFGFVDRISGEYYWSNIDPGFVFVTKGRCTPAPFTGFGAEKVKF